MRVSTKRALRYALMLGVATGGMLPLAIAMPPVEESRPVIVEAAMSEDAPKPRNLNSNAILLQKLQAMQDEIQALRGKVEVQAHDLKLLNQQNRALYSDLDQRMTTLANNTSRANLVAHSAGTARGTIEAATSDVPGIDAEKEAYNAAYELIQTKQFNLAQIAMKTFIETFPDSQYVANAHYWLGELNLNQHQNEAAIAEFKLVCEKYAKSPKASSALYKLGVAYTDTHDHAAARSSFTKVIAQYPDSVSAKLAKASLAKLDASAPSV